MTVGSLPVGSLPVGATVPDGALVVVALGGNALLRAGEVADIPTQRGHAHHACMLLAALARRYRLVVTHGNGPQAGLLSQVQDAGTAPLDVVDAETEGLIGYLLGQELRNALPGAEVVTLLTQTIVDAGDPAFGRPTKPIGIGERRRLVASPEPLGFVEIDAIRLLVASGVIVICVGGGGIPVTVDAAGGLRGIEAVVDKDLASARLAQALDARALLLLTDVDGVYDGFGTATPVLVRRATVAELRSRGLPAGSMGPKVEAACRFVEAGGIAAIGAMDDALAVLGGTAGTHIVAE